MSSIPGTAAAAAALVALAGCANIGGAAPDAAGLGLPADGGFDHVGDPIDAGPSDASLPADARTCTDGDFRVEDPDSGRCYLYFKISDGWQGARLRCLSVGAELAAIGSQAENDLVAGLAANNTDYPEVWLGGSDLNAEGSFAWLSGEPFGFTGWAAGEPNQNGGTAEEDCVAMRTDTLGAWNDETCSGALTFVCERGAP